MNAIKAMDLIEKYSFCPNCGSNYLGAGEGAMNVGDTLLTRECSCGYKVVVDQSGEILKEIIP